MITDNDENIYAEDDEKENFGIQAVPQETVKALEGHIPASIEPDDTFDDFDEEAGKGAEKDVNEDDYEDDYEDEVEEPKVANEVETETPEVADEVETESPVVDEGEMKSEEAKDDDNINSMSSEQLEKYLVTLQKENDRNEKELESIKAATREILKAQIIAARNKRDELVQDIQIAREIKERISRD